MLVDELLRDLRRMQNRIALGTDEFGTAVGLVTDEDVVEEVVGEAGESSSIRREDGTMSLRGPTPVTVAREAFGIELERAHEATLGGHIVELLGRVPLEGEKVVIDELELEIEEIQNGSVTAVRVRGEA